MVPSYPQMTDFHCEKVLHVDLKISLKYILNLISFSYKCYTILGTEHVKEQAIDLLGEDVFFYKSCYHLFGENKFSSGGLEK